MVENDSNPGSSDLEFVLSPMPISILEMDPDNHRIVSYLMEEQYWGGPSLPVQKKCIYNFQTLHHSGKVKQALSYRMERQKLLGTKEYGQGIKPSQRREDTRWQLKPVSVETVTTSLLTDGKAPCQNLPTQEGAQNASWPERRSPVASKSRSKN